MYSLVLAPPSRMVNCCIACAMPLLSLSFSLFPLTPFKSPWKHHSTETTHAFQIASLSRMRMPVVPRLLFLLCPLGRSHRQTEIIQVVLRSVSSVIVKMGDSKIWGLQHVLCFSILGTQKNIKHKKTQILCFMLYVLCLCRFRILGLLQWCLVKWDEQEVPQAWLKANCLYLTWLYCRSGGDATLVVAFKDSVCTSR